MIDYPWRGSVAIAGVGATRQGVHDVDASHLGVEAFRRALDDAQIARDEIDGILTARQFDGSGLEPKEFARLIGVSPRVTAALDYGTGGYTTQYAALLVAAGICNVVACIYARNPSTEIGMISGGAMYDGIYGYTNAAGLAALSWSQYMARYSPPETLLGLVAVTQRHNARRNPLAANTEPLTMDDYLAQPHNVWPLRPLDIAHITGGGAAIIITTAKRVRGKGKRTVVFQGMGRQDAPRRLQEHGYFACEGMRGAAEQVYQTAGLSPSDIDVLAVSDASTVAVVQTLENYGFCGAGEAGDFVAADSISADGVLPVNTDGGQLSGGYLVGWLHQIELVNQLRGRAGERQVPNATVGQYCTTGGRREHFLSTIYRVEED